MHLNDRNLRGFFGLARIGNRRVLPVLLLHVLMLLRAHVGTAYVRTLGIKSRVPIYWAESNCIFIRPHVTGYTPLNSDTEYAAVKRATENWNSEISDCSYMRFIYRNPENVRFTIDRNGVNDNVVYWVYADWAKVDSVTELELRNPCASAVTLLTYSDRSDDPEVGRILHARIELNADQSVKCNGISSPFSFATDGSAGKTDIENTLTHELGHVLGIDHNCDEQREYYDAELEANVPLPTPVDQDGNPVPLCASVASSSVIAKQTMFVSANTGELSKRTIESDDRQAMCDIYPIAEDPGECNPVDLTPVESGGCHISALRAGDSKDSAPEALGDRLAWTLIFAGLAFYYGLKYSSFL